MFPYTITSVRPTYRRYTNLIPAIDRISSVEATRPVQKSWVYQYGNSGQPQRVPRAHRVSRNDRKQAQQIETDAVEPPIGIIPRGPKNSIDDIYFKETTDLISLRAPVESIPPEYIERRAEDLSDYLEDRFLALAT